MFTRIKTCVVAMALAGCGPQLKSSGKSTVPTEDKEKVTEQGAKVELEGTASAKVPPNAIPQGGTVAIEETTQPTEFQAAGDSIAAAPAISLTAKGPDGTPLTKASEPMQVALEIPSESGLALAPAASKENLCVLLKALDNSLIVWRRAAIELDETAGVATVASPYFGVYQLVYCGQEALAGFKDAGLIGLGAGPKASLSLSVPAGFHSTLGHGAYCAVLVAEDRSVKSIDAIQVAQVDVQSAAPSVLDLSVSASVFRESLGYYIGLVLLPAGGVCPFTAASSIKTANVAGATEVLAWNIPYTALAADQASGTVGEGPIYGIETLKVRLGVPQEDIKISAPHSYDTACIRGHIGDAMGMLRIKIDSEGRINGTEELSLAVAQGAGADAEVELQLGGPCELGDNKLGSDASKGEPYWVRSPKQAKSEVFYFSPVAMRIDNQAPQVYSGNACLDVYAKGGTNPLGRRLLSLNQPEYGIYLPYLPAHTGAQNGNGTPYYDLKVSVLGAATDCSATPTLPAVPIKDRPLSAEIVIELKASL